MSFQRNTVLEIVKQAMGELGLTQPTAVDGNSDLNVVQFFTLLKSAIDEVASGHQWEQLSKEHTFTTVSSTESYALPSDYLNIIDETQWDRTNDWPLLGPLPASSWQTLKSGNFTGGLRAKFRLKRGRVFIHPVPTAAENFVYEYVSNKYILKVSGSDTNENDFASVITDDGDTPFLDWWLLVKFIKLKFWETKGFDTTSFRDDFINKCEQVIGRAGAPRLSLVAQNNSYLLNIGNIPETGYGS